MLCLLTVLSLFHLPILKAVHVDIDGTIDVGPYFRVKDQPSKNSKIKTLPDDIPNDASDLDSNQEIKFTQLEVRVTPDKSVLFVRTHKVKDDKRIRDFSIHVYKQNLKVFDDIKKKIDDKEMKNKLDELAKSYKRKFRDFFEETQEHIIKTKLGTQKVIYNTIETANRIMKRLANFMMIDDSRRIANNIFEREIDKVTEIEFGHACQKFGLCLRTSGFSDYLSELFKEFLKSENDTMFEDIGAALVGAINEQNYNKIMTPKTESNVKSSLAQAYDLGGSALRNMFTIIGQVISERNKPELLEDTQDSKVAINTVAFLDMLRVFDDGYVIEGNARNVWDEVKASVIKWRNNWNSSREGINEPMKKLVNNFVTDCMDHLSYSDSNVLMNRISIIAD